MTKRKGHIFWHLVVMEVPLGGRCTTSVKCVVARRQRQLLNNRLELSRQSESSCIVRGGRRVHCCFLTRHVVKTRDAGKIYIYAAGVIAQECRRHLRCF